ncbi:MAG: hypothetical protein BMS9Abin28_1793 [Anaerolineae bacterium]|nr:MAG: hypothetical protein BMS9Abin28_1793 [Anaerolineae bacterium]
MFWNLFLAHLLGDFPLQPMWLVRSKSQLWGLVLHANIHLLSMLLLVGAFRSEIWPQVLALATVHFVVDVVKYRLTESRPEWVTSSYFIDQAIHILSIIVVAAWIEVIVPEAGAAFNSALLITISGYILVTHVWFVTEKTVSHAESGYNQEVQSTLWPRMMARATFLTVLVAVGTFGFGVAAAVQFPYYRDSYWRRALITDLIVAVVIAVSIGVAISSI